MGTPISYTDYAYDDAGNMTDKDIDNRPGVGVDEAWGYVYNSENRQTKVEKDTGEGMAEVGEYIYNVLGNRVSREVNQTTTYEIYYDGADCVGDDDGTTQRYFITPGLDENLLLNDGSDDYYYTQDGLGSVRELVDTDQDTQNYYDYEAFGSPYNPQPSPPIVNTFTYTGREWDTESATYYYRARQYHSSIGRFNGRDPVREESLYLYTRNLPTIYVDPSGLAEYSRKEKTLGKDWNIKYGQFDKLGVACALRDNADTRVLSKGVALKVAEVHKWLLKSDKANNYQKGEKIKQGDEFYFPNMVVVAIGDMTSRGSLQSLQWANARKRGGDSVDLARSRGYYVWDLTGRGAAAIPESQRGPTVPPETRMFYYGFHATKPILMGAFKHPHLFGLWILAHGHVGQNVLFAYNYEKVYPATDPVVMSSIIAAAEFRDNLHHTPGIAWMLFCYSKSFDIAFSKHGKPKTHLSYAVKKSMAQTTKEGNDIWPDPRGN